MPPLQIVLTIAIVWIISFIIAAIREYRTERRRKYVQRY